MIFTLHSCAWMIRSDVCCAEMTIWSTLPIRLADDWKRFKCWHTRSCIMIEFPGQRQWHNKIEFPTSSKTLIGGQRQLGIPTRTSTHHHDYQMNSKENIIKNKETQLLRGIDDITRHCNPDHYVPIFLCWERSTTKKKKPWQTNDSIYTLQHHQMDVYV